MSIKRLYISGFKSIDEIELTDVNSFSVFAGANGSGKSNFFDALAFVSMIIKYSATDAIRKYGGYAQIQCFKKDEDAAKTFKFSIEIESNNQHLWKYDLEVKNMDKNPVLSELFYSKDDNLLERKDGSVIRPGLNKDEKSFPQYPHDRSAMIIYFDFFMYKWLTNIKVFRIDPLGAKEPDSAGADISELDMKGHNVATMLASLEDDDDFRETVMEWMELIVPGLEKVSTEQQKLDSRVGLKFREEGIKRDFPANLVSDGTIYVLCILTAVLTRSTETGLTLIEEPERGINPKAVAEIVNLMREYSSNEHPVWVTTHNETLVRSSRPEELLLVNKKDGKTRFKYGRDSADAVEGMPLDKAWLSNLFGGGLPW